MRKTRIVSGQIANSAYRSLSVGLFPDDYAKIERAAIAANLSNSEMLRQLVHDWLWLNEPPAAGV